MAGLEGTVNTPFGTVQKKTALYVGGAVVILGAIVVYRQKKLGGGTSTTPTDGEIDPATGYPYGSPEDAAALAQQGSYVSPTTGGGGSSTIPNSNVGYTTNAQWVQAVIDYMTSNDLVGDSSQLSSALGKYITGAYVAPDGPEDSLIHQAIAVQGYPPVPGPAGYPPSINRNAPTTTPTPGSTKPGPITGLHATKVGTTAITLAWNIAKGDKGYDIQWTEPNGSRRVNKSVDPTYTAGSLTKNHTYTFSVRARPITGSTYGDWATVTVKTKAK